MPEPKQTTLDTLAEMLAEYKRTIEQLNESGRFCSDTTMLQANKIAEQEKIIDRLNGEISAMKQDPNRPTLYLLGLEKKLCEEKSKRIFELEKEVEHLSHLNRQQVNELEKLQANQKNDDTMPDCKTKLCAFWKGFNEGGKHIKELNQERDALKLENESLNRFPPTPGEIATANKNAELEKELAELRKEKEHYEKVAQDYVSHNQIQSHCIVRLEARVAELIKEAEKIKPERSYREGHKNGFNEAISKIQESAMKLRK